MFSVGDRVILDRKDGGRDVATIVTISEKCIGTVNCNMKKEYWRHDGSPVSSVGERMNLDASFLEGSRSELIRVDKSRISKAGPCDACNDGFVSSFGEFIPDYQNILVFSIGVKKFNLCPACFIRMKMAMMFPISESLDEYKVRLFSDEVKNRVTFNPELFFELMAELDKDEPDLEDVSRILRGKEKGK